MQKKKPSNPNSRKPVRGKSDPVDPKKRTTPAPDRRPPGVKKLDSANPGDKKTYNSPKKEFVPKPKKPIPDVNYYFLIWKPFGMLSQFTREDNGPEIMTLAEIPGLPKDVYPLGRLDKDSEGLLILTNNASLNSRYLNPDNHINKTYWVQVEGQITEDAAVHLEKGGLLIENYLTKPCKVKILTEEQTQIIPERDPPVRFRKSIPTSWVEIILQEGKNRQIRKMTAQIGFPTLRLIRLGFGGVKVGFDFINKQKEEMMERDILKLLNEV
jgi:23S rRNA pseudouridine2457 synthase